VVPQGSGLAGAIESDVMPERFALKKCPLLTVVAILAGIAFGQTSQPAVSTAFTLDLRTYGWQPAGGRQHSVDKPSIVVDHERRVVVGFTIQARSGLVTRNQPSLDFRVMRFSPDGKVDLSLSLATHEKGRNAVYLSDTDQIIVRANDSLQVLQEGTWKTLCPQSCRVSQSPSRRTLVLYTKTADPPLTIVHFSPQLALRGCGKRDQFIQSSDDSFQNYAQSITDKFVYFHGWDAESGYFTYRWPLCDYEDRVQIALHVGSRLSVLNDDTFAAYPYSKQRKNEELEVISSDGQVKFRPTMQPHESAGTTWTSMKSNENGKLIAVDLLTIRGTNNALDISGHVTARRVAVFDIEAGAQLASIPVSPKHRYGFQFDLSPDGHRLAILEDGKLQVVDIEESGKVK
jgi:hypothetical protein